MTLSEPADPRRLSRRAREMIDAGRVLAARPVFAALQRMEPQMPGLADLEARLLVREGRTPDALVVLDAAIAADENPVDLLLLRAELRLERGEALQAADDAASAVIAAPRNARAKAMLGVTCMHLDRIEEATSCLAESVTDAPDHPGYRQALAEAQERGGDPAAAAATLEGAIARWPAHLSLRVAAMMVAMRQRAFARAIDMAEDARRHGVGDACVFGLLGHALSSLGRHAAADDAYAEALKLAPEDPYVRHLAAASGTRIAGSRAPASYIETVFDGYAERFESHLVELEYRIPGLIRTTLLALHPGIRVGLQTPTGAGASDPCLGDVLDLGCGTGFMGVVLSDLPFRRLVGIDLSGKMLAQAARKNIYDELRQADIETILAEDPENAEDVGCWDVVIAADVFSYFGDLARLLVLAARRLGPGGWLLFSLEVLRDDEMPTETPTGAPTGAPDWRLHRQGRYAHRRAYISNVASASSLVLHRIATEHLRREAGMPVEGVIVTLQRPRT